ncbi:MAG TPA: hypothetical protein VFF66_09720 [Brevundimonas sp.]|nr:hypothetical protein [Brevundimonas sp.]
MRAFAPLAAALTLPLTAGGCATPVEPGGPPTTGAGDDCAVIAAVAKEHYRFNTTDNVPPPLWLDSEGSGWAPRCDWSRHGLRFPATFDPDDRPQPQRVQWVSFKQPRYDGSGALIQTGILHGPLAGMGYECRVHSGFAGWTVGECRNTWIS